MWQYIFFLITCTCYLRIFILIQIFNFFFFRFFRKFKCLNFYVLYFRLFTTLKTVANQLEEICLNNEDKFLLEKNLFDELQDPETCTENGCSVTDALSWCLIIIRSNQSTIKRQQTKYYNFYSDFFLTHFLMFFFFKYSILSLCFKSIFYFLVRIFVYYWTSKNMASPSLSTYICTIFAVINS